MNQVRWRKSVSSLLLLLGTAAPMMGQAVILRVECGDDVTVTTESGASLPGRVAHFGFFNPSETPINQTAGGSTNFISPGNPNVGQPSTFPAGYAPYVFSTIHPAARDLVWIVGTQFTVDRSGTAGCSDTAKPFLVPVPLRLAAGSTNLGVELMKVAWVTRPAVLPTFTAAVDVWIGYNLPRFERNADVTITNLRVTDTAVLGDLVVSASPVRATYALSVKLLQGTQGVVAKSAPLEVFSSCSLTVSPSALPAGVSNSVYGPVAFSASGATAPYSFEVASGRLPNGMQLGNGSLGGTPSETGTFAFVLNITSADRCLVQQPYTLVIGGPTCAADVTGNVSITLGGFRQNLITGRWQQTVALNNRSGAAIQGPVSVALQGLSANASLYNSSGTTQCAAPAGRPYLRVNLAGGTWLPGQTLTATLDFVNTTPGQAITYTPRVLVGGLGQ